MNKFLFIFLICACSLSVKAQTRPYGVIDTADLKITTCDFEKDANAMVLFDKADFETGLTSTTMHRHKRLKILNDKGKDQADVTIEYVGDQNYEEISEVEAETINRDNNVITFTKVDNALIYKQIIDKTTKRITFSFPRVTAGSVIEYTYKLKIGYIGKIPGWNFQEKLPVRYSELKASIRSDFIYKFIPHVYNQYTVNTVERWIADANDTTAREYTWALSNINSYRDEPYATGKEDNIQSMQFILTHVKTPLSGTLRRVELTWDQIAADLFDETDFGGQLHKKITSDDLFRAIKHSSTDEAKVEYIFNSVKKSIKWNGKNRWYTIDGVKKTWDDKSGNATEINFVLFCLFKQAGIKCGLEVVSTRENGKINSSHHWMDQFNKTDVSVTIKGKKYIMDASGKYNTWNDIPFDILNSYGFFLEPSTKKYGIELITNESPSRKVVSVNADIMTGGELEGTAQVNNFDYNRIEDLALYNELGENKYINLLKNDDNNLTVTSYKQENAEITSLPLTEDIVFKLELVADNGYIYFHPNLFTTFYTNPFLSEVRNSTIDFGSVNNYVVNCRYKMPEGYKIEALPKSSSLVMADKSISFERVVAGQDNDIVVHYIIDFKKSLFLREEYPAVRDFYKKMYEMLDEQIVLKKT